MNDYLHEFPKEVYSICQFEFGIVIHGKVPEHDLLDLEKIFIDRYNFNMIDHDIARFFGGSYCYTTPEKSSLWKKNLGI